MQKGGYTILQSATAMASGSTYAGLKPIVAKLKAYRKPLLIDIIVTISSTDYHCVGFVPYELKSTTTVVQFIANSTVHYMTITNSTGAIAIS